MNAEINNVIGVSARAFAHSSWNLASTRPCLETVALQNLWQQGFDAYHPLYKCLKKTDASIKAIFVPMFARCVFARPAQPAQFIAPVRSTRGVVQLIRFGNGLATICADALDAIWQFEQQRNAADVAELSSLRPGHAVRFYNLVLNGLEGVAKSVSSLRVTVLLEFMGHERRVSVDRYQLKVA